MPITIPSSVTQENNKLSSDNISYVLLEITYGSEDPVRICLNNASVTWNSLTWYPAIFSISGLNETKDAEIPSMTLTFVDITRTLTRLIDENAGIVGATVVMRIVNSKEMSTTPELEENMEILGCSIDGGNKITFQLGAENLINRRCPKNRYLKNHCRFVFRSTLCGFAGLDVYPNKTCNLTLEDCRTNKNNQTRFGGFPGVGISGFKA